jgi:amino-acid N-acetyltransferase
MTHAATSLPELRAAIPTDLPAIERLLQASDLPTVGIDEASCNFIVAEADGDIVGVVGIETCCGQYALLRSTAVKDAWRGRRVGRLLVERAIAEAESRGFDALYLLTTTAEHYFPSFGFSKVDRASLPDEVKATEEFRSACPASATVMTLSLT